MWSFKIRNERQEVCGDATKLLDLQPQYTVRQTAQKQFMFGYGDPQLFRCCRKKKKEFPLIGPDFNTHHLFLCGIR